MNETSLEQRILEAAEEYERDKSYVAEFHASDIKALLEEKNREREEWKRIAGGLRDALHGCVDALAAVLIESPLAENQVKHMLAGGATELKAYDALTGKGEPK